MTVETNLDAGGDDQAVLLTQWTARNPTDRTGKTMADMYDSAFRSTYVGDGATMTVAQLLTNYPAAAALLGKYARVSDLFGGTDEIMRCGVSGSTYYWRPQRTDYAAAARTTATSGAVSLVPLVTPPTVFIDGTLLGNLSVTPSATNAWPGAQFTVAAKGILGIFGINLTGVTGGTLPLLAGGSRSLIYTGAAWEGY